MDFLISVTGKIAEYAIEPVGRQFGYLFYYNSNIETLKAKVQELENDRLRTSESVVAAERNGESVFPDVQKWLTSVDRIRDEFTEFLNNQVNENQKCFSRQFPCPDLVSRYRVSRKSSKKSLQVDELLKDVIKFDHKVAAPARLPAASSMFAEHVEAFESRKSTFEVIMEALKNDQVNMIGVYGMGGIGKTTMVKHVAKVAEQEQPKLFDVFAFAVVSQIHNVHKIQGEIAIVLGLTLGDKENEHVRAGRLLERIMKKDERILLVLDDLWTPITLAEIGIPCGREHAHKCCKIILTSRNLDVCQQMNCDSFIPIGVLSDTDAWNYFRAIAGDAVDSPDLRPIPAEIVAKCAGLPIAIKTIGGALKGKSQHVWKDAHTQLRNSTAQNIQGVDKNVYSVLQVSYNFLNSEELRNCFLISCLFEEDADISMEDLVRYGLGLNLFQGVDSVEGARDRAYVLVDNLKARSLLMDVKTDNSAKMHDVIRDFAHFLASSSNDHVFLVRQGAEIIEWPNRDSCNRYTAISLLSQQIFELPRGLDCSKLEILIFEQVLRMTKLEQILNIPSNFFQGMKQLRVLKMRNCRMFIPESITLLKDLETLCLEHSYLEDLSQIGGLKKLKVLSLDGSYFKELPRENGLPRNLMVLDLSRCEYLKVVPPNLISSLTKLECLYMLNTYDQWSWGGRNATVGELKHLHHLNTLEMHLSDISLLPRDLSFQNLIRFRVSLGNHEIMCRNIRRDLGKMLVISLEPDHNNNLPDGVKTLMKRAQALTVVFKGYNNPAEEYRHPSALSDLNEDGFKTLRYLKVEENYSMKYLVDSSNASTTRSFFPVLEDLRLRKLGLNEICNDDLPDGSFGKLRELELSYLPNLTKLWSMNDSARYPRLMNLRYVEISHCKELKHVFPHSALALLGELKTLTIGNCKSLEGIFLEDRPQTGDVIQLPKLQLLMIRSLPSLKSFCFQKNNAHAGQLLGTKILFPALRKLVFSKCKNIVTVFPSNVQHCLPNLADLEIAHCESLVAILELEDNVTSMLPQWQQSELPREFPSLKTIDISFCPKIKAFAVAASSMVDLIPPFFDETVSFPALERLLLRYLDMPKQIWDPRLLPVNSFCSLTEVKFNYCRSLITIFPSNVLPRLQCLREITLDSCDLLERVFDADDAHKVTLPGLQSLYLFRLRADLIRSFFSEKNMFPVLQKLYLEDLNDVKGTIFPSSVLRRLKNLELICIENCKLVEEVFGFDDDDAATFPFLKEIKIMNCPKMKTFMAAHAYEHNLSGDYIQPFFHEKNMFPALQKLYLKGLNDVKRTIFPSSVLRGLKNLECIQITACELVEEVFGFDDDDAATVTCGGGTATFPFMKEMGIWNCPKMKTFMAAHAHEHNLSGDYIQHFFHEKVELPVLENLTIWGLQDVEELWHDKSHVGSFCQLQTLRVKDCSKLLNVIPLRILITMKNLDKISVQNCESIKEVVKIDGLISGDEGAVDDEILTRSHLRRLTLINLPKLTKLWWNKDRSGIFSCPDLQRLKVDGCHGLRNIFVPSAIKHDMNIKWLTVADCSNMEEVVGEEERGGYSGDKLQFRLVEYLSLANLPNLRSFYKGNYILEWPSLSEMVMNDCPNMATFCLGLVSTPRLKGLTQNEDNEEVLREGDTINDIIRHLYIQRKLVQRKNRKKKHQLLKKLILE